MNNPSLGEGNTPLVQSVRIGPAIGLGRLFFKLELCNPSGSYKDRFIAAQMRQISSLGVKACIATSSGNTGSSLAAFCARNGVSCTIVVNQDVPAGKLTQMQAHGARVLRVKDFVTSPIVTDRVLGRLVAISGTGRASLVISAYRFCPEGMAGVESISGELARQCDSPINHVFVPVGGGGLFAAVCRGFAKQSEPMPRVHAVQPEGCSTVVAAWNRGDDQIRPVTSTTRISGLAVPFDVDAGLALEQLRRFRGYGFAVSDLEVFEAQRMMLEQEGIYAEPAGAAALAGLCQAARKGLVSRDETVVCLVTGHGFKDQDSMLQAVARHPSALIHESEVEAYLFEFIPPCP